MQSSIGFAFFKPSGLFGWLIVFKTAMFKREARFYHVEVYDPSKTIIDATESKQYWCFSAYEGDGGVRSKFIALDKVGATRIEFPVETGRLQRAWAWALKQNEMPYDWASIRGFVVPWRRGREDAWICSELCCAFAQMLGMVDNQINPSRVSPARLWELLGKPW